MAQFFEPRHTGTGVAEGETQFGTWPSTIVIIIIFLSDKLLKNFRGRVVMFQGPNVI